MGDFCEEQRDLNQIIESVSYNEKVGFMNKSFNPNFEPDQLVQMNREVYP